MILPEKRSSSSSNSNPNPNPVASSSKHITTTDIQVPKNSSDLASSLSVAPPTYSLTSGAETAANVSDSTTDWNSRSNRENPNVTDKRRAVSRTHTPAHSRTELLSPDDETASYPPPGPAMTSPTVSAAGRTMRIDQQPSQKETMSMQVLGSRNARKLPVDLRGKRDWNSGLWGCCDNEMDTCRTACFCPCIIFGRNKTRLDHLANHNLPEPSGGQVAGDCATHGIMSFIILTGCALQIPLRATIRDRYSIPGSCLGDCCASYFCYSCSLTQEHIEISAEEHSFPRGVGGSSGAYYDDPMRVKSTSMV